MSDSKDVSLEKIKGITERVLTSVRYRSEWAFRRHTQSLRVLPDFLIIGGMKCGTTALYHYLLQHPKIRGSAKKEVHFFDNNFEKGIGWYRQFFPLKVSMQGRFTGEATPYYIFHPEAPRRIRRCLPRIRLIAILRNPVDRAYSHYQHTKRKGFERLSFEEAIESEQERIEQEVEYLLADPDYKSHHHQAHSYVERGIYWKQLKRYYECFDSSELLVVQSEKLLEDPQSVIDRVTEFLEIDPYQLENVAPVNKAKYSRERTKMHERLAELYRPHNEKLYEMIGRDFGWNEAIS